MENYSINKPTEAQEKTYRRIETACREANLYYDGLDVAPNGTTVNITITNGDWKHEHLRLRNLMRDLGFERVDTEQLGESDDDCYSAIHTFMEK